MIFLLLVFATLFTSGCNAAVLGSPGSSEQLVRQIRQSALQEPPGLKIQSLLAAAEILRPTEPSAADGFIRDCLTLLQSGKSIEAQITTKVLEAGMRISPAEVLESVPFIPDRRAVNNTLINYYLKQRCPKKAITLVNQSRRQGMTGLSGAILILGQLIQQQPSRGVDFFNQMLNSAPSTLNPEQALFLLRAVREVVIINPSLALRAIFRVAVSAQSGEFSRNFPGTLTARYRIGGRDVWTSDVRESVLLPALAYLHVLAPDKYAEFATGSEHEELLNTVTWATLFNSTQPLQIVWLKPDSKPAPKPEIIALAGRDLSPHGSASLLPVQAEERGPERSLDDLFENLSQGETSSRARRAMERRALQELRHMPLDRERVGAAAELLSLAASEESAATLEPITGFLLDSLRPLATGTLPSSVGDPGDVWCASMYSFVALQIHQHRMAAPENDPSLTTRLTLLDLRDHLQEAYDFTLKDTKAHQYTLRQFRGHAVLLRFWAPQCGTCVRNLPELEKFHRKNVHKDVVVLAIDERASTTGSFPEARGYTFPLLSDEDGAVSGYFGISVIPTTVVIDQTGKIAGSIVGEATSDQLRQMIGKAKRSQEK
ncbi:MAG: TlpA family protein disulfide reductase [Acidobacteriota bacterium]|nr:TlpA family protein disulfide reductase [Acidobacteriota bacterium]